MLWAENITHFIFCVGEAIYMCSASELQRVSVSAAHILTPSGSVEISKDARPKEDEVVVDKKIVEEAKQSTATTVTAPVAIKIEEITEGGSNTQGFIRLMLALQSYLLYNPVDFEILQKSDRSTTEVCNREEKNK